MGFPIYEGRNGDGDPLLFGSERAGGVLATPGAASARPLGRHVAVAVGVGRAGVGGIGKDAVHHRSRPSTALGTREPGPGIQALEDLADAHPLLDEPAVEHPDQLCLVLLDHEMSRDAVSLGDVAVTVGRSAADEVSLARFL
jgi:hypothetical protein